MGYAVHLYFDSELESAFLKARTALTTAGVTPTLDRLGDRPHVSLAVMDVANAGKCIAVVQDFAHQTARMPTGLDAFGSFPTAQGVVYLSPDPTSALFDAHRQICERLEGTGTQIHKYYLPDNWVPHATIGFELPHAEVQLALGWLQANFKPLRGEFASIGLVEFPPVTELASFPLRALTAASTLTRVGASRVGEAER